MGGVVVETSSVASMPLDDLDIIHLVCCADEDTSLCGEDMTEAEWADEPTMVCLPCELEARRLGCPFGHECDVYDE